MNNKEKVELWLLRIKNEPSRWTVRQAMDDIFPYGNLGYTGTVTIGKNFGTPGVSGTCGGSGGSGGYACTGGRNEPLAM